MFVKVKVKVNVVDLDYRLRAVGYRGAKMEKSKRPWLSLHD